MIAVIIFLLLAIPLVVIATSYLEKYHQENDTQSYQAHKDTVTIGTSLDYNRLSYFTQILIEKYKLEVDPKPFWQQSKQLDLFKTACKLGFRNLRLNFRWKDLSSNGTDVDFKNISQILDFLESQDNLQLTLCFGPYKNFSYPEQYVPNQISEKYLTKNQVNTITPTHPINTVAKDYLTNLLSKLTKDYPNIVKQTIAFQTNNEGFHPFGSIPIKSTPQTEYEIMKLIEKFLPSQKILFNTPIVSFPRRFDEIFHPDIADIQAFLQFLEKNDPQILFKSILGLNYYSSVGDGLHKTPFATLDSITATRIISTFTRNPTLKQFNAYLTQLLNKYQADDSGFTVKISELQEETWNGEFSGEETGKTVAISQTNITRLLTYLNTIYPFKNISIDIWGAEQMAAYNYLHTIQPASPKLFVENLVKSQKVLQYYKDNFKF